MVKRFKRFITLMCTAVIFAGSLQTPVSAASKTNEDELQFENNTRAAEIKKYGGEERGGIAFYPLDEILDDNADEMTYEVFAKSTKDDLEESSLARGTYKDIIKKRDWYSYGSKYMYNQLNSTEKAFYNRLYSYCLYFLTNANTNKKVETNYKSYDITVNGMKLRESLTVGFKVNSISLERAKELVMMFNYENPQFYFLASEVFFSREAVYLTFYDKFQDSVSRAGVTNSTFDTIDACAETVKNQSTDQQKARKAEELVMARNKYSYSQQIPGAHYTEYYDQSLYSTFNLGYTVCAGYCKGVQAILRKAGMGAMAVTSTNHGWNLVKVNGHWYNLDATWDDVDSGAYRTDFFLKSDAYMTLNDRYDQYNMPAHQRTNEWNGSPVCAANYGDAWPSLYANINSKVDSAEGQEASMKQALDKPYTPKLISGKISVSLSKKSFEYDGSVKTPKVTVKMGGQKLATSEYNIKYSKGRRDPGVYKVTVSLKSVTGYKASKTVKFKIAPKKTSIKKVTNTGSGVQISWNKGKGKISGYQIQISPTKSFSSGVKTLKLKKPSVTSKTLSTLASGKVYYFRIRTFKSNGSGVAYSKWSKARGLTVR